MTCLHLVRSHVTTSHPSIDCTLFLLFFFFNDTATTEIYTLSLHDALPILRHDARERQSPEPGAEQRDRERSHGAGEQETVTPRAVEDGPRPPGPDDQRIGVWKELRRPNHQERLWARIERRNRECDTKVAELHGVSRSKVRGHVGPMPSSRSQARGFAVTPCLSRRPPRGRSAAGRDAPCATPPRRRRRPPRPRM